MWRKFQQQDIFKNRTLVKTCLLSNTDDKVIISIYIVFLSCYFESSLIPVQLSPPPWWNVFERGARLLSRSGGNNHVVNAYFENWILDKQSFSCVTWIAQMVNKPCSFERGTFTLIIGDVKFITLQRFWGEKLDSMSERISEKWLAFYFFYPMSFSVSIDDRSSTMKT